MSTIDTPTVAAVRAMLQPLSVPAPRPPSLRRYPEGRAGAPRRNRERNRRTYALVAAGLTPAQTAARAAYAAQRAAAQRARLGRPCKEPA